MKSRISLTCRCKTSEIQTRNRFTSGYSFTRRLWRIRIGFWPKMAASLRSTSVSQQSYLQRSQLLVWTSKMPYLATCNQSLQRTSLWHVGSFTEPRNSSFESIISRSKEDRFNKPKILFGTIKASSENFLEAQNSFRSFIKA